MAANSLSESSISKRFWPLALSCLMLWFNKLVYEPAAVGVANEVPKFSPQPDFVM